MLSLDVDLVSEVQWGDGACARILGPQLQCDPASLHLPSTGSQGSAVPPTLPTPRSPTSPSRPRMAAILATGSSLGSAGELKR